MDTKELQAIKDRAEKATPGPWQARPKILSARGETECEIVGNVGFGYSTPVCKLYTGFYRYEQDKHFIKQAITDIPALIAEVERFRGVLFEWVQQTGSHLLVDHLHERGLINDAEYPDWIKAAKEWSRI